MSFEFFVSYRYLKAKRKQTFISIITFISIGGVALGVMTLIVVLSVMSGFENDIKTKILGLNSHALVLSWNNVIEDYGRVGDRVDTVPGVVASTPFILTQVMLSANEKVTGVALRGVDIPSAPKVIDINRILKKGDWKNLERTPGEAEAGASPLPGIILGQELARSLGLGLEDPVSVISPLGRCLLWGGCPK